MRFTTLTVIVSVNPPSSVVTVIIAEPTATPDAMPFSLMVTADSSEEVNVTFWFVAFAGIRL